MLNALKKFGASKLFLTTIIGLFIFLSIITIMFSSPQETAHAYVSLNSGSIGAGGGAGVSLRPNGGGYACYYFSFTPSTTKTYRFYSTSNSGDPYFYLVNQSQLNSALNAINSAGCRTSGFSYLTADDDSNGNLNFSATYLCIAGTTYYLLCTAYNTNNTSYNVYIENTTRYTYTLNNQSATSSGSTAFYVDYVGGSYRTYVGNTETSYITIPEKTGYVFNGYYTGTNGSGNIMVHSNGYIAPSSYTNSTLYAYWVPLTYYVRYYPNGGTISSGSYYQQNASYNTTYNYVTNTTAGISRPGYTFLGWSTSSSATSASFTSANTFNNLTTTNGGVINLYAVWSANTYSIRYYPNGGSCSSGSYYQVPYTYGTTYNYLTSSSAGISRSGYTFLGWSSSSSATDASFLSGEAFSNLTTTQGGTVNRYAVWVANNYTVKYFANSGSGSMDDSTFSFNTSYSLPTNAFTRTNYNFLGWSTNSSALIPDYTNGQSVNNMTSEPGGTVNLYAVWESDIYYLNYNLEGGVSGINSPSYINFNVLANISNPTKAGYLFIGWTVSGTGYNSTSAKYSLNGITLTTVSNSNLKCGYFTNIDGTYFKNLSSTPDGQITLTANWLLNEFDVAFYDYNGTTVLKASEIYHYGDSVTPPINPTRAVDKSFSYSFLGWTPDGVNIYSPEELPAVGVEDINFVAVYTRTYLYQLTIGSTITGSASGNPGDRITIDYSIDINCGISSLMLLFDYDANSLRIISAIPYDKNNPTSTFYYTSGYSGFHGTPSGNLSSNPYRIVWEGLPNHSGTGLLIRMVFEITETAGGGAYEIGLGIVEAATTNIQISSDSKAYRTYGTQGEFSDVKINYTPTQIFIQTDGTITINEDQSKIYDGNPVTSGQNSEDIRFFYDGDGAVTVKYYLADGTTELGAAPTNVGTYWIGVSAAEGQYYNPVAEVKQQFTILPQVLNYTSSNITTSNKTYTGNLISWITGDISAYPQYTSLTSVSGSWTNVGNYNITVRLTADSNYTFYGTAGDYRDFSVPVSILQATNLWTVELTCADYQYGGSPSPYAEALFGDISFTYSTELEGVYTSSMPSDNIGLYYVKAIVQETSNYIGLEEIITFTVNPMVLDIQSSDILSIAKVYTGSVLEWTTDNFTAPVNTAINSVEIIIGQDYQNVGNPTITVNLKADSNYTFEGTAGDIKAFTVTLTIIRANTSLSIVTSSLAYDGNAVQSSDFVVSYPGDGFLIFTWYEDNDNIRGEEILAPINTGKYWVGVNALQGNNYNAVSIVYRQFLITATDNEWIIQLTIDGWTYGDAPNSPHAEALYFEEGEPEYSYKPINEGEYSSSVPTEAGTYIVRATIAKTNNYEGLVAYYEFTIAPKLIEYTVMDITCQSSSKYYIASELEWLTGEFTAPSFTSIYEVNKILGQDYINVGNPTITVILVADSNHTFETLAGDTASFTYTLTILQATNIWTATLTCENITYGQSPDPQANAQFKNFFEPTYKYSIGEFEEYHEVAPVNAGTYWVKAYVEGTTNYTSLISDAVSFTINKATYNMSGISFNNGSVVYNGNEHSIYITGILPDGVSVNYTGNGQTIVGSYPITAVFTGDYDNYNVIGDMNATLTINPASLASISASNITAQDKTYTGLELVWEIGDFIAPINSSVDDVNKIFNQNYINAGYPTVYVTLKAGSNYTFQGTAGDTKVFTVTLTINQAVNEWVVVLNCLDVTYGSDPSPIASALFMDLGEPVYTYSTSQLGVYTSSKPVNAGTYYVKATVEQTNNYTGLESDPLMFNINPFSLASLTAEDISAQDKVYTGLELEWVLTDFSFNANTAINAVNKIDGQDYVNFGNPTITVTLIAGSNYTFNGTAGDTKDFVVILSITQAINEWTIALTCEGIIYGGILSPDAAALFMGIDEPSYTYSTEEDGEYSSDIPTEAGIYWVKATVTGTANYTGLIAKVQFIIGGLSVTKPVVVGTLVYNSQVQSPNIAVSVRYTISGNNATNAGIYTATISLIDKDNTMWADETTDDLELSWTIQKAQVTFTAQNKWTYYYQELASFTYSTTGTVYNGELSPYVTSVVTSTSNAGNYALVMNCEQDENNNYNITLVNGTYTVIPALITLTSDNKTSEYSEQIQQLTYQITSGEVFGMDSLNVEMSTLATSLSNVGQYAITISAGNTNYNFTLINGTYTITHKILTQENIQYTVEPKAYAGSAITWIIAEINVIGATISSISYDPMQDYINAGYYTISVSATSKSNYTFNQDIPAVSGDSMELTLDVEIIQAVNSWTQALSVADKVYDTQLIISATARFSALGEPVYTFSTEVNGEYTTIVPTQVGTYYVKATVIGTDNYTGLISEIEQFSITVRYIAMPFLSATYTYNGAEQTVTENNLGDSEYYTKMGTDTAKNAGSYDLTYTLDDIVNTQWSDYSTDALVISWNIQRASITLTAQDKSSEYGADILELTFIISNGINYNNEIVPELTTAATSVSNVGEYTIDITASDDNYNITLVIGTYYITYATYDMSGISFSNGTFTYDKTQKYIFINGELPSGIIVEYLGNGEENANPIGYTVTAIFTGDSNYNQIENMTALLIINRAQITFNADPQFSDYGEEIKLLTYTTIGENYDGLIPELSTEVTSEYGVGVYDIVIICMPNDNYNITCNNSIYTIYKAINTWIVNLTCSDITYGGLVAPYAEAKFYDIGEPAYRYSLSEFGTYTTDIPVNAGIYWVKAIVLETANYMGLEATVSFTIAKATINTSGFIFEDKTVTYNGTIQTITITGELPNGVTVNYINNTLKDVGFINATAEFTLSDPNNYEAIAEMYATLTINPAPITLTADNKTSAYGAPLVELTYTVTSGQVYNNEVEPFLNGLETPYTNVGIYEGIISIFASHYNYDITLVSGTYTITQAVNTWTLVLMASNSIYGDELNVNAESSFGSVVLYYSTDPEAGFTTNVPEFVNTYYVKAVVEEDMNYSELESDIVSFNIVKASLSQAILSYLGGTVTWNEVTTTVNGLTVSNVTYTVDGILNAERSYAATGETLGYVITAIPEDTDNYASSSVTTIRVFSVTFNTDYGTTPDTQYIFNGYFAQQPAELTSNTHTFFRWKENVLNNTWFFNERTVDENVLLIAEWTASVFNIIYIDGVTNITLDLPEAYNGYQSYTYGQGLTLIHFSPYLKTGYTFNYWADIEGIQVSAISTTTFGDITVYANWLTNEYTITYYSSYDGADYIRLDTQYYDYGTTTQAISNPQDIRYFRYEKWYIDEERTTLYTFTTMPAVNIVLYGAYIWDIGLGDVNGDGYVDTDDITIFRLWLVGGYAAEIINAVPDYQGDILLRVADVNGDGLIDIRDVSSIRMAIVGGYSYGILTTITGSAVTGEEIAKVVEINGNVNIMVVQDGLTITGTMTGDYDATFVGTWTGVANNCNLFTGTMSGDIQGTFTASMNANGIDTLFARIDVLGAIRPVRLIAAAVPDSGFDYQGYLITSYEPDYVESMEITATDNIFTVQVGQTLQLGINVIPIGASTEIHWSIYVNDAEKASIDFDTGLVTGLQEGTVLVIAKAADGSHIVATKTITVYNN